MKTTLLATVAVLTLAGCGGGGSASRPQPVNAAPSIGAIADLTIQGNGQGTAMVSLSDDQTPVDRLSVSVFSDTESLLPAAGISISGSDATRTIDIAPVIDELGSATLTVVVEDEQGRSATSAFNVTVVGVDTPAAAFTRDLFLVSADAAPVKVNALNILNDAQDDDFTDLLN